MRLLALGFLSICLLLSPLAPARAADTSITITYVRAVRLSDSSITLSFLTDQASIGNVGYVAPDETEFTLTDSAPQNDHLFTIDDLDPKHPYSFRITATYESKGSNTYVVLLSPELIGTPGQSIMPGLQVLSPEGELIDAKLSGPSTSTPSTTLSPWLFIFFALIAVLVTLGNQLVKRLRSRNTLP